MKTIRLGSGLISALLLTACVTVNIYFPAAQAQEAAEMIVEDILGEKSSSRINEPASKGDDRGASSVAPIAVRLVSGVVDLLVPVAQAGQPNFSVNTPEIRSLQAQLKNRHRSLLSYYENGAIGYTRDALVGKRDLGAVPLKQRAKLNKLIADENNDRSRLYQAIAKANGHPEWEKDVRKVFADTWVEKAEAGWWYQNSSGQWSQK